MHPLVRRIGARAERLRLALTGERLTGLVSVSADTAHAVAERYEGVSAETFRQRDGLSATVPKSLPEDRSDTIRPFEIVRETAVFDVRHPDFFFSNGLMIDPERRAFFAETITESEVLGVNRHAPRHRRKVPGTVAYLSNTWVDNYYHWLQLTVPMLEFYPPDVDFYYIGKSRLAAVQVATLERLGIGPDRILREPCRAERLLSAVILAPPQFHGMRYRDVWSHRFAREIFGAVPPVDGPRRLYVRRGAVRNRRIVNEPEMEAALARHGFVPVTMDGRSIRDQASLFAGAEAIVGAHGAALTNILFTRPRTTVLEIFPAAVQEPGMFAVSTHAQAHYGFLLGEDAGENGTDIHVPLPKLDRALAMMGLASG